MHLSSSPCFAQNHIPVVNRFRSFSLNLNNQPFPTSWPVCDRRKLLIPILITIFPLTSYANEGKVQALAAQLAAVEFTGKVEAASDKAQKLASKGLFAEAEQQWSLVIDLYSNTDNPVNLTPQALYRLAKSLTFRGDVRMQQGEAAENTEKLRAAAADYLRAMQLQGDPEVGAKAGLALAEAGDVVAAEERLSAALLAPIAKPEARGRILYSLGVVRERQGRWAEAAENYATAADATRGSTAVLRRLALARFQAGDEGGALRVLRDRSRWEGLGGPMEGAEDMPAALAAAEFAGAGGDPATGKSVLANVLEADKRFAQPNYLRNTCKWPPRLVAAMERLLADTTKPSL